VCPELSLCSVLFLYDKNVWIFCICLLTYLKHNAVFQNVTCPTASFTDLAEIVSRIEPVKAPVADGESGDPAELQKLWEGQRGRDGHLLLPCAFSDCFPPTPRAVSCAGLGLAAGAGLCWAEPLSAGEPEPAPARTLRVSPPLPPPGSRMVLPW